MATGVASWSQTAATNATADSAVNWAEGQAPSTVNDSARGMMASVAKWRDDQAGTLTTGGTATAYTVTSNQVFASLAAMSGQSIRLKFNATNGATPTLNVDGLGAKSIVTLTGTAIGTGSLIANTIYELVYSNSSSEWILINAGANVSFASGTGLVFYQTAAPTGWTAAAINDKALRVVSATGGVTGGTTAFSSVFAARTIAQANLPSVNLTLSSNVVTAGTTAAANFTGSATPYISVLTTTAVTAALGGSGTQMDFAVQYADCLICTKN